MKTRVAAVGVILLVVSACASFERRRFYIPAFPDFESKAAGTFDKRFGRDSIWPLVQDIENSEGTRDLKQFLRGIESMQIRYYAFRQPGAYSREDLDILSNKLMSAGWSRSAQAQVGGTKEYMETFAAVEEGEPVGYMVLRGRPQDVMIINFVGKLDIETVKRASAIFADPKNLPTTNTERRRRDSQYLKVQPSVVGTK